MQQCINAFFVSGNELVTACQLVQSNKMFSASCNGLMTACGGECPSMCGSASGLTNAMTQVDCWTSADSPAGGTNEFSNEA